VKIYQFIKYNQETKIIHIKHYGNENLVICFDFEDGIQNGLDENQTIKLKEKYRNYFIQLLAKFDSESKVGVRLNSKNSCELKKDLIAIKDKFIHSIFLPKIENSNELINIKKSIDDNGVNYKELVPIIENKVGLEHIEEIIEIPKIESIAFGHCDYNLSLNIFPFFHHNKNEYWKWINKIVLATNKAKINFINSPYLSNNNREFYCSMLGHLKTITNNNFGQITLSNIHTDICINQSKYKKIKFNKLLSNRHQLYETSDYAKILIESYERNNKGLGLSRNNERIIAYQEYIAAKKIFLKNKQETINLTFVGGCFPVQHNILYEDIFLVKSKKDIENKFKINLNIDIIRYERFTNLIDKIIKLNKRNNIEILILSIRPEPLLRIIKLYYKYINKEGKLKKSLNIPFFNIVNPEKYDYLMLGRLYDYNTKDKKSNIHSILVSLNYIVGLLAGNLKYALNRYIELIKDIDNYCKENNIELILLGPNLRNNNNMEPYFCKKLDEKIRKNFPKKEIIKGLDMVYKNKSVFNENGIHVNELYHDMIAKRINKTLIELLSPTKNIVYLADSAKIEDGGIEDVIDKCRNIK
jgi:citrate lyase beta subunit